MSTGGLYMHTHMCMFPHMYNKLNTLIYTKEYKIVSCSYFGFIAGLEGL